MKICDNSIFMLKKYLWAKPKNGKRCFTKISQSPDNIDWTTARIVQSSVNDDNILVLTDTGIIYHFRLCCHDLHIELITREIMTKRQFAYYPEIRIRTCGRFYFIFSIQDLMIVGTDCSVDFCGRYQRSFDLSSMSPKIVKVATGFNHILALTSEGEIYGWGVNTHGQLNFNRENLPKTQEIKSPTKIFIPNVKHVSDIAAMKYISAFKSSHDGLIYIQGCLNNLKIKRLAICEYTNIFDRYNSSFHSLEEENRTLTLQDQYILYNLECGILDSFLKFTSDLTIEVNGEFIYVHKFILKLRSLYFKNMFEFNEVENRKRVIKYDDYSYDTYKRFFVFLYTGRLYCVIKVATGFDHILVLTTEGKVYGWGVNTHGILRQLNFNRKNVPETTQIKSPSKIYIPNVNNVSDIAAMKYISAFKSSYDGRIYIQGCLHKLQLEHLAICEYTNIFDRYNSSFHSLEKNRTLTQEDENILDDLSNAFYDDSEFTSDLTIEVNGEFIYVHKSILKMRSLYFKNMFEFSEVENRKRVIKYDDYPYKTYRKFFKFLYTGWVYFEHINQMIELLILADKYCVTNLEKECIKQLKIHMEPSTVSYIKEIAIMYNKTVAVYYLFFYYFFFKIKIIIYNELDILIQLNFNSLCFFYTFFIPVFVT
ncbi:RCBT1 protein, partial [Acromyrmex charruanus]